MKKVFVVTSGSYSDYRILAIFSTKKLAKDFIDAVKDDECNGIEEHDLDNDTVDLIKRGYSVWSVNMLINGDTERCDRQENGRHNVINCPSFQIWERTKAPAYRGNGIPDILTANVWAKTEKQAIKIVNEKRAQMIASGKFK